VPDAAGDIAALLRSWIEMLRATPWEILLEATLSRGRNLRMMTVWIFGRDDAVVNAWESGSFEYVGYPAAVERADRIGSKDELLELAEGIAARFEAFAPDEEKEVWEVLVGQMPFSKLLGFHRLQTAYHYRQVVDFLRGRDVLNLDTIDVDSWPGLRLPAALYRPA
jgi:hypothetical protein